MAEEESGGRYAACGVGNTAFGIRHSVGRNVLEITILVDYRRSLAASRKPQAAIARTRNPAYRPTLPTQAGGRQAAGRSADFNLRKSARKKNHPDCNKGCPDCHIRREAGYKDKYRYNCIKISIFPLNYVKSIINYEVKN